MRLVSSTVQGSPRWLEFVSTNIPLGVKVVELQVTVSICFCSVDSLQVSWSNCRGWHHQSKGKPQRSFRTASPFAEEKPYNPDGIKLPHCADQWMPQPSASFTLTSAIVSMSTWASVCRGFLAANDWGSMVLSIMEKLWQRRIFSCVFHVFHTAPGSLPRHDIRVVHHPSVSAHVYTQPIHVYAFDRSQSKMVPEQRSTTGIL